MKKSLFDSIAAVPVTDDVRFSNKPSKDEDLSAAALAAVEACLVTEEKDGVLYIRNSPPFLRKNGERQP